jgi:DNA-directed RNA polymerase specialized sigma24 family protein
MPSCYKDRSPSQPSLPHVYERHGTFVRRYVVRRVGANAGEDLATEVFERAFRVRERYRAESGSAPPWLLGIASNVIADHRRAERRRLAALELLALSAPELVEHDAAGSPRSSCTSSGVCALPTATRCCSSSGASCPTKMRRTLSRCRWARSPRGSRVPGGD